MKEMVLDVLIPVVCVIGIVVVVISLVAIGVEIAHWIQSLL